MTEPLHRKGGRPRVIKEETSSVTAWVSARHHERLSSLARRHDVSVSSLVRRAVSNGTVKATTRAP